MVGPTKAWPPEVRQSRTAVSTVSVGEQGGEKCEAREHAWMAEELYKGHAYTESEFIEELDGFGGSTLRGEQCIRS
jgi:hypothetical protein